MVGNAAHTLAYSLIALQEMNLATYYPTIYWNCACLISDSKGIRNEEAEEEDDEAEKEKETYEYAFVEEFIDEEEIESEEEEEQEEPTTQKKKKVSKTSDYGKVATAIGKFQASGIKVYPPDINKSKYTFYPDEERNIILYGMSGVVGIGQDIVDEIIEKRPYEGLHDLLEKVKLKKPQMINLIKSGALNQFGERAILMREYLIEIADLKKRLTMQNLAKLIEYNFIPSEKFDFEIRLFNFNKYLKKMKYQLNQRALVFYEQYFEMDSLKTINKADILFEIKKETWKQMYDKKMLVVKKYIKDNQEELLENFNEYLYNLVKEKYAKGTFSRWEMDSISYYYGEHELANVDYEKEGFSNYFSLPEDPSVSYSFLPKGSTYKVNLYEIHRIAGTVLDKDKNKRLVTILTREGVVTVRIFGEAFNHYNRQISRKNPITGKKKVIEKSWFSRGNKIIVTGIKINGSFQAKKYSKTPHHLVELIEHVNKDGNIIVKTERDEE